MARAMGFNPGGIGHIVEEAEHVLGSLKPVEHIARLHHEPHLDGPVHDSVCGGFEKKRGGSRG